MNDTPNHEHSLAAYRPWFYAAAIYNTAWGIVTILFPNAFFELIGMGPLEHPSLWRVVGMFLLVYAPAFWWVARQPVSGMRTSCSSPPLGRCSAPSVSQFAWLAGELPGQRRPAAHRERL